MSDSLSSFKNVISQADLYGPRTEFGRIMHATKYRAPEETFDDYCVRYSRAVTDNEKDFRRCLKYTRDQYLLPAGRQQHSVGRPYLTTAFNCFVNGQIPDSLQGIMDALTEGTMTLRTGGGVGWDFSSLRPEGELIRGLGHGSFSSGPISFMRIWDVACHVILTAGHRRGAMMGVLRVDHPDILKFITAKKDGQTLKNFNISVALTDEFMDALANDGLYDLKFNGAIHATVRAVDVWALIMENNWDWAEPGVLFIDRINERNPLSYCEQIYATNPCGEQPLPPYGACLLGSLNMVKFLRPKHDKLNLRLLASRLDVESPSLVWVKPEVHSQYEIDYELMQDVVDCAVRAFDNVIDRTNFPLPQQKAEAKAKRRMGLGYTGMANCLEILGYGYGSPQYLEMQKGLGLDITLQAYRSSIKLSREKGSFPAFDRDKHVEGWFVNNVIPELKDEIRRYGLRNGLLTSQAPTGTISMCADNVSSGIEPPFALKTKMSIHMPGTGGHMVDFEVTDHALEFYGVKGKVSGEVTAEEHIDVLCSAQWAVDSACSKTCNVTGQIAGEGPGMTFDAYKKLYLRAWEGGAKGCTTFNINGKRMGVRESLDRGEDAAAKEFVQDDGLACFVDPATGLRSCE